MEYYRSFPWWGGVKFYFKYDESVPVPSDDDNDDWVQVSPDVVTRALGFDVEERENKIKNEIRSVIEKRGEMLKSGKSYQKLVVYIQRKGGETV